MNAIYKTDFTIHSYESDHKGNASILSLCDFMQEVAWKHAEMLEVGFSQLSKKNLIWVLLRQSISIYQIPVWGDKIALKTYPCGYDKLYCYRKFEIFNSENILIGEAIFTWMVIDRESKRPQKTDTYFFLDLPEQFQKIPEDIPPKLIKDASGEIIRSIAVSISDLDVNNHVNNVTYIKWIIDSLNIDLYNSKSIKKITTNFWAEAAYGDKIDIGIIQNDENCYHYFVSRNADEKLLFSADIYFNDER